MPNLMLTNWCNYKCPYCFGMDFMAPRVEKKNMSKDTFLGIIHWLSQTPEARSIHLMGGEPTLHPDFEWIVENLLSRDYRITLFSNLATPQAQQYAEKLANLPITWVVNVNPPQTWNATNQERISKSLKLLGSKATITFNIMPEEEDNEWALDLIKQYNLSKEIKIGFVLPTVTGSNYSLSDMEYIDVAQKVVRLATRAEQDGIRLDYECGIPTCTFTEEQLGVLWDTNSVFNSTCYSRLDITPEGECIYCLPMATKAAVHYSEFENYLVAKEWFEKKWRPYRSLGRTQHCHTCNLMNPHTCHGGCLAKMLLTAKNV